MCPLHPESPSLHYLSRFSKSTTLGALLHAVPQGQICLLLQVFLDFPLLHSSPL